MAEIEGSPRAPREVRVAVLVSRYNEVVTTRLLEGARQCLREQGVPDARVDVIWVPGAFELAVAAEAAAATGRYAALVALGCVIRGETPHFEYVASEAASGLQLAALETGVPVAFGVLTVETIEQAEARVGKGAEAARTGLEMADAFAQLRASAAAR